MREATALTASNQGCPASCVLEVFSVTKPSCAGMVLAGQRRQLVVCVVSDLTPSSGHAVWISGGSGSILQSFAYGASQEDGGTVCSVSLLSSDPPRERELACHVGANRTSPSHSSSPIRLTGMTLLPPPLPASAMLPTLLMAVRVVLLKVLLSDAVLTSILLGKSPQFGVGVWKTLEIFWRLERGSPNGGRRRPCWLGKVQDGNLGLGGQERGAD
uniref:Ig-like domain-containing protein n=1 Tax=Catharus ustulatus TaxID=91951 RepID=A0A8C3XXK1_CATUS